jgi:acetyl-CoA decarbonylase/synthase complex subunit gamma
MKSLEIYNLLPKKNCGECGVPTCLAFAMKLASRKGEPKQCPYLSEESRKILEQQSGAPVKEIRFNNIKIGGETVLYRHEKTFYNPPPFAVLIRDDDPELKSKVESACSIKVDRLGQVLQLEFFALAASDFEKSKQAIQLIKQSNRQIIYTGNLDLISGLLKIEKGIVFCDYYDFQKAVEIACKNSVPVAVKGSIAELQECTKKAAQLNFENLIFVPAADNSKQMFDMLVKIRQEAVVNNKKELGYPVMSFARNLEQAALSTAKYGSLVVLENIKNNEIISLLTLRQNIFSDPQKPIQVDPGIYEINNPGNESLLLVTSNFSLTFFNVKADIEHSGMPSYLLVVDTEGLSVLTAWAAGKFSADSIAKSILNFKVHEKTDNKEIIIPGLVAMISGELEEKTGYRILVGPRDSSALPAYFKTLEMKNGKL